jgi:predicted GH43/DUF377 family glycosyl hydrolase
MGRNSKMAVGDNRSLPFLKDMMRTAMFYADDRDIFCLTRATTALGERATDRILEQTPCYAHRITTHDGAPRFSPAADVFCFTKQWWKDHRNEVPDLIVANDFHWPRVLMEVIRRNGGKEARNIGYRPESHTQGKIPAGNAARAAHNEKLASAYLAEHNITFLFPAAESQVESIIVNQSALARHGYNPSIIRHEGKLLMTYRAHPDGTSRTGLHLAGLSDSLDVLWSKKIEVEALGNSIEDARLFTHEGKLCASFVDSFHHGGHFTSVVRVGHLLESFKWKISDCWTPRYGRNDGTAMEKNWVFFSHAGNLWAFYQQGPEKRILLRFDGREVAEVIESPSANLFPNQLTKRKWMWGQIKGGTTPVPLKDRLLTFFHSTLDNEPSPNRRRYYVGAMILAPEPPFEILKTSMEPIIYGSEADSAPVLQRATCAHRKEKVVFPMGVAPLGGERGRYLLSVGINDSQCALAKITNLHL